MISFTTVIRSPINWSNFRIMERDQKKKKEVIRQALLARRRSLPREKIVEKSKAIHQLFFGLAEFKNAVSIHCYISMESTGEVITDPIINNALKAGKTVFVPRVEKGGQLSHHKISDLRKLTENRWGVREPEIDQPADPEKSDIVIVPMTGGDRRKNRLGYGKGYYDRFLSELNKPVKIGLLFDFTLSSEPLPTEEFDVRLDMLITESEIIW